VFSKHPATTAVPYAANCVGERRRQVIGAIAIPLKQVKCDALRGLLTNARHAAKAINQANQ
jgi:hypothetical protein